MLSMPEIWQLRHVVNLLVLPPDLTLHNMWLQPLVEVGGANTGVDDCKDNQYNRDDRETGETLPNWNIVLFVGRLVHSGKFEDEVGQAAKEQEDGHNHPELVLTPCPKGGHEQYEDRDWDGSNRETKFCICQSSYDNQELHGEAQEKEEVEFQQGNVNLSRRQ